MGRHPCEFARDGAIYVFHHGEVCGEEDVEVSLVHEGGGDLYVAALVAGLDDGGVEARDRVGGRKVVEVGEDEAVGGEVGGQDVEELEEAGGMNSGGERVRGEGQGMAQVAEEFGVFGYRGDELVAGGEFADLEVAGGQEGRGCGRRIQRTRHRRR